MDDDEPVTDESRLDEIESGAAERLIFFSDAVVAIAITLLALELPVPTGDTPSQFWASVVDNNDDYTAFFVSFVVIAVHWSKHHHVFRYVSRSDRALRALNLLWLLVIILTPFATKLLSEDSGDDNTHAIRWGFYALLQALASLTFLAMVRHAINHSLVDPDTPPDQSRRTSYGVAGPILGFGLSIPLFFLTRYAWVLWIIGPLVVGRVVAHRDDRNRRPVPRSRA
jgi:uncharacterized membrane protein